ncbi:MAG: 50S ribosomal protein L3 [Armatimonadetes bacterium]|nr:50S ribosomal protein L3 [Armatimonadota bacterium]
MNASIMGKKLGMTQLFGPDGRVIPVTVIEAGPCVVTQLKTVETDGYNAVQVGYGDIKEKKVNKPMAGHFKKGAVTPKRHLKEFRVETTEGLAVGQEIKVDAFREGDKVAVTGISKGKGFAGVVKRYHFHGGPASHGSMTHRKPQSAGATDAARVFKGVKRPGHMGAEQVTQRGFKVIRIDAERNLLMINGPVPGPAGGLITIVCKKPARR